ncbi:O-antigen ligase family protein [Zobellia alginiliquefaciens]|uniref:O-antigen ligase family protein n=1 Tax=Zobellia alginiliquefaciens TaxID=3032586 RepID=UPI0023E3B8A2|nr:O-antigen ligase family protein [Zobellia alginiliquefaciens]
MLEKIKNEGYYYGALLYAFLIPFHQKLATLVLIAWAILSIFSFKKSDTHKNWCWAVLPIFYLLYFIGCFTAETPYFGFLETKLSFLIFPLLFFLHSYTAPQRMNMLKVFIFGLLGAGLLCFIFSCYRSIEIQEGSLYFRANVLGGKGFIEAILYGGNYFFGNYFSIFHQTVYYALYLCSGIAILLFYPKLFSEKSRRCILLIFTLFIFLISNKASFIALGMLFIFRLTIMKISSSKKMIGLIVIFGMMAVFVLMNPRTKEAVKKVTAGELKINKNARYGFTTRILTWDAAWSLIKEKPILGYGAGETQLKLNGVYKEKEYQHPLKETYNAHNLWLQTWLENGILSLLLLVGIFALLFQKSIKNKEYQSFFLALVLLVIINTFFESMFNRFSGVSFFSFLVCFILSISRGEIAKK